MATAEKSPELTVVKTISLPFVREASGIAYIPGSDTFIIVGDEGDIVEISKEGKLLRSAYFPGDLEAVSFHRNTHTIYILEERTPEIRAVDYRTFSPGNTLPFLTLFRLSRTDQKDIKGWEGLFIRSDEVFYISPQISRKKNPFLFIGKDNIFEITTIKKSIKDISDITYDETTKRLYLLSDSEDTLFILDQNENLTSYRIPGKVQEGITLDSEGFLWMTDEEGCLYKMPPP